MGTWGICWHTPTLSVNRSQLCTTAWPTLRAAKLGGVSHKLWITSSFKEVTEDQMWTTPIVGLPQTQTSEEYSKGETRRQDLNCAKTNILGSFLIILAIFS